MPFEIDGPKGTTPEYRRNWVRNFQWNDAERAHYAKIVAKGCPEDLAFEETEERRILGCDRKAE